MNKNETNKYETNKVDIKKDNSKRCNIVNPFSDYYDKTFRTGGTAPQASRGVETAYQIMKSLALVKSNQITKRDKKRNKEHSDEKIIIGTKYGNCEISVDVDSACNNAVVENASCSSMTMSNSAGSSITMGNSTGTSPRVLCGLAYIDIACIAGFTAYDVILLLEHSDYNKVYVCSRCEFEQKKQK